MNHSESSEDGKQNSAEKHDGEERRSTAIVPSQDSSTADGTGTDTSVEKHKQKSPARRRRQWIGIVGAIALLLGGGFLGWRWWQTSNTQGQSPPGQNQPQAIPVNISTVNSSTLEQTSEFVAQLESRKAVTLLPQVQGRVAQILVSPGDNVKAGTPLIQIDPDEQQASVSAAQAAVAAARSQVAQARATLRSLEAQRQSTLSQLQLSQKQYERYSNLAQQGAISRETRDEYLNELQTARASLGTINKQIEAQQAAVTQAQEALQQAQANIKRSQVQLQYFQVNAPFAGTVGAIPVKVGDFVNTSTQLTSVTQNQPLEVNISIPRERAAQVETGTLVQLLNEQGEKIGDSRVFFISPQTTSDTQSVLIKALFKNSPTVLRANSYVRARVIWDRRPGVLVPTTAVTRIGGQSFVYVVQQQAQSQPGQPQLIAQQRPVKLGNIQGDSYQVLEGLKPEDRIVTSGLLNLRDGAPITTAGESGG